MDDLDGLIDRLERWRGSDTGVEGPTPREQAVAALRERGPEAVTALVARLEALLAETSAYRERTAAVTRVWDIWYEESDRLGDEYGSMDNIEPHRTVATDSLPERPARDHAAGRRNDLKQGIVEALHMLGDGQAGPVLTTALSDPACIPAAAAALCDIHADGAVPALLDAVPLVDHRVNSSIVYAPLLRAVRRYGVTLAQARERFEAETAPLARVRLLHLMEELPDDGTGRPDPSEVRDALVFVAMDDKDTGAQWGAIAALCPEEGPEAEEAPHPFGREAGPPAHVVRAAIAVAARGNPPGHGRELAYRLRRLAVESSHVVRAVETVLTRTSPVPDDEELLLALRLAQRANTSTMAPDAPLRLVRALYAATSHPRVGERALAVLHRQDYDLFKLMTDGDPAVRAEARAVFDAVADPELRSGFARFKARHGGLGSRLLGLFRR
ncbi:hypothetical protein [Streptomyces sp. NPDC050560]|uniref:hypothetical protein n=1 Tax=Streptomyces sp. NPDC050560 TaxID=3365630 RepID=UPI0037B5B77E